MNSADVDPILATPFRHPGAALAPAAGPGLAKVLDRVMPGFDIERPVDVPSLLD